MGKDNFTPVHPDDMENVQHSVAEAVSNPGTTSSSMQLRLQHADGSWRWIESRCTSLLDDPAVGGIVFNSRDITKRKEAQEALREAEAKYRTLVEQLPAITYINTRAPISDKLYVSPQIESILGVSVAEWTSDPRFWVTLLHPEDRQRVLAEVARSYQAGEPLVTEYRMIACDGRVVWFRDEAMPVRDDAGRFYYHHGVMLEARHSGRAALRRAA